jgi:hypothetical protein
MPSWIHFMFSTASLVSLLVIRLRPAQREILRNIEPFTSRVGASGKGPASSSQSRAVVRNSKDRAGRV